jgi:hypothetical protein
MHITLYNRNPVVSSKTYPQYTFTHYFSWMFKEKVLWQRWYNPSYLQGSLVYSEQDQEMHTYLCWGPKGSYEILSLLFLLMRWHELLIWRSLDKNDIITILCLSDLSNNLLCLILNKVTNQIPMKGHLSLSFFLFLVVLGLELRAYTLSHSTSPFLWWVFFEIGSRKLFAWDDFEPVLRNWKIL